ncbi:MAG TPA: SDR family oxidoreductase [Longimicrobium sp.]|nr:SDR family oxidoreductase [Longimicrobium sp.]
MGVTLKPVSEQVIVITGADSGIGLATARLAARRGACLVLNSRNEPELARLAAEMRREFNAQVEWHCADVADLRGMMETAEVAIRAFGRIDTWLNNAGVSAYGMIEDVPLDDARRIFETNYWGTVNGSLAALPYLKAHGGALINVGSILSDTYVPLQGHYTASKHAVKGFTDALRVELMHQKAPVSVTLVKPAAIDTPYPQHAGNYMDAEPKHPHPVYAPEVVARAIVHCAEHPRRSVTVGGGGRMMGLVGKDAPGLNDVMGQGMFKQQKRHDQPEIPHEDTLWEPPARTGRVRGDQPGYIMKHSAYTAATLHPVRTGLALAGIALGWAVATGATGGLLRRGREWVDTLRGGDGMSDDDIDVQVRAQPAYAAPRSEAVIITEEVYVLDDAAVGDHFTP